jgi:hypothetical protein
MCEDIFGCDHAPEIPISDNGQIVFWVCRCGARQVEPRPPTPPRDPAAEAGSDADATTKPVS